LLNEYLRLDPRVRLLFRAVKHWGKARGIVDAQRGYFNSFALTLMMLFSLQHKGVLPVLQRRAGRRINRINRQIDPSLEMGLPSSR
jgi:DNA polymerase sigma